MIKTLVVVRHGDARRDEVVLSDVERPLTPRGRRETAAAASKFATLGCPGAIIVTSPAQRALDTADIWKKSLKVPAIHLRIEPKLYEAEQRDILQQVRQLDDADDTVVLIGHNPGVTHLLHHLVGRDIERMNLSAFAVISIDVDRWNHLALRDAELVHYYAPPADAQLQSLSQRFVFGYRKRVQKVELFLVFLIGLLVILVAVVVTMTMNLGAK